ncbi:MAG: ImmA/IrrE family metallo-endopeptidase [Chloroflexota bacterium]
MALTWVFRESCERIAVEYRRKLGNRFAYDALPASELLDDLHITIVSPESLQYLTLTAEQRQHLETVSGGVVSIAPIVVLYNPSHSPARHESNMMHECAHIILKHPMIPFDPALPFPPRDPKCEEEAIYLGGCLQIPKRGLLWAIQKGVNVEQTANHFGASTEMVYYRANVLRLRKHIDANW